VWVRRATLEPRQSAHRQCEWNAAVGCYWRDAKARLRGDAATPASQWLFQPECLSEFAPRSAHGVSINATCCRPGCLELKIQKFQMLPHTKY
jgi:hypothetical protein